MLQIVVLGLLAVASANPTHNGNCPDLKAVENFNLAAYQGVWYEISKLPTEAEKNGKCSQAEYKLEGDVVKVKNTHVVNGVQQFVEGTAKLAADANKSAKLIVSLKFGDIVSDSPLKVVATDYTKYAIAHNCKYDEKTKTHTDKLWVLSRTKKLEGDAKTAVDKFLKEQAKDIDTTKLVHTDFSEEACKFTSTAPITVPANPAKKS